MKRRRELRERLLSASCRGLDDLRRSLLKSMLSGLISCSLTSRKKPSEFHTYFSGECLSRLWCTFDTRIHRIDRFSPNAFGSGQSVLLPSYTMMAELSFSIFVASRWCFFSHERVRMMVATYDLQQNRLPCRWKRFQFPLVVYDEKR